jgi:hypothetical protein
VSAERWDRLAAALTAAGVPATVTAKAYSQVEYGRVVHGVSRTIWLGQGEGLIVIRDHYGRGGKWYGYAVSITEGDHDRDLRRSTKRSEVVAAVIEALAR